MESTLVMIKPNGVLNGLVGEIISRYEKSRLSIRAIKITNLSKNKVGGFYAEHEKKVFFQKLVEFVTSGPVILMVLYGENAIETARAINGATSPLDALPGSIRYDFAPDERRNIIHSSDNPQSARWEVEYWFTPDDLVTYSPHSFVN